jgi:hypothetical protein
MVAQTKGGKEQKGGKEHKREEQLLEVILSGTTK